MRKHTPFFVIFYFFVAVVLTLQSPSVFAATINVDISNPACSDSGDGIITPFCNIQPAVDYAAPGDVVNIAAGTYGAPNTYAFSVVEIYKDIQLQGAGMGQTTIDGGGLIQGIFIHDGFNVSLSSVSIVNSRAVQGAAIYNRGNLTLSDSELAENTADHGGGGIYHADVPSMTAILERVWIHNNRAFELFSDVIVSGGGGVYNLGTMQIIESKIENNYVDNIGGGVLNEKPPVGIADLRIIASTIQNNDARSSGGVSNHAKMFIENSTIANNMAIRTPDSSGGGISSVYDSELTMVNSTISGNSATLHGGGIQKKTPADVMLHNVTITQNTVGQPNRSGPALGGGIYAVGFPNLRMTHSIVAGNSTTEGGTDCYQAVESMGFNLIGIDEGCDIFNSGFGDIIGFGFPIDPMLAPLQDNGGPTHTHALLAGSPAIDAGDAAGCPAPDFTGPLMVDQRSAPRPPLNGPTSSPICDMGAFEFGSNPPDGGGSGGGSTDTDGDGIPDDWEILYGLLPEDPNDASLDPDSDGLTNLAEFQAGTNPINPDSDSDSMQDGWEIQYGLNPLDASDAWIDSDNDGLFNVDEAANGSNPNSADTDADGLPDPWEVMAGLNPTDPSDALLDADGDGLSNLEEFQARTNPNGVDSDGDTISDGDEINQGLNPLHRDSDNDGLADNEEPGLGLDPLNPDTDGDTILDGFEFGRVIRASVGHDGNLMGYATEGNSGAAVSADGRYVAFVSDATGLVANDTNGQYDVFVRDTLLGATTRVSVASDGAEGDNWSGRLVNSISVSLSADGRYVAFASAASNLVANDTNGQADVFVHDRVSGTTERVSVTSAGTQVVGFSVGPNLSADGRFVTFESSASDLLPGPDNNGFYSDIFVHDRDTKETTLVSRSNAGISGDGDSEMPVISADGRFIAYSSQSTNLVANDTNGASYFGKDVFVFDRLGGSTKRVSVASDGSEGNNSSGGSYGVSISSDGRFVAFASHANNLVANDNNVRSDIFVHDTQSGETSRVSVATGGTEALDYSVNPAISGDGRFVAFMSTAKNLAAVDPYNGSDDVFLHDRLTGETHILSVDNNGQHNFYILAGRYGLTMTPDGKYVAFRAWTGSLVPGNGFSRSDIFVAKRPEGTPQIRISNPGDGELLIAGSDTVFQATAIDAEDGDMTAAIQWESSVDGILGTGSGIVAVLSPGDHQISARVTDSSGRQGTASATVTVNALPLIGNIEPVDNRVFNEGALITFSALAFDNEDGILTDDLQWTSSIDGSIGTGSGFTRQLSVGSHIIQVSVTDSAGSTAVASRNLRVNGNPVVTIVSPTILSVFDTNANITFSATAIDPEEGDLSAAISWSSSIDGLIGSGGTVIAPLSSGLHTISATVYDNEGGGKIQSTLIIVNTPPLLSVIAPMDGLQVDDGDLIAFEAVASDAEDGDLAATVQWTSSIDGSLGVGGPLLRTLSVGSHSITASVSDSRGEAVAVSLTVVVNAKPTITINSPSGNPIVTSGTAVSLQATASDAEDGDLTAAVQWSSSLDGSLGSGNISTMLSVGIHSLTATVADSTGASVSATASVTINAAPTLNIIAPLDGLLVNQPVSIVFEANAIDTEDGDISANIQWSSSISGILGSGFQIVKTLTPGQHVVTATIVDSNGVSRASTVNVTVNSVPTVNISFLMNPEARYTENDDVAFSGTASDLEDGTLPVSWTSSIDGDLGTFLTLVTKLSPGLHTITGLTSDTDGGGASDSITLRIYGVPRVSISAPLNGSVIQQGQILQLTASASDPEDGDKSAAIQWVSSIDGPLGAGGTLSATLSAGTHVLTSSVTDSDGFSASATVSVMVNAPPQIAIASPAGGSQFRDTDTVTFQASATDAEDGNIAASINWTSNIDGALGSGSSFSGTLSAGSHLISANVTDGHGATVTATVAITVVSNTAPQVSISSPSSSGSYRDDVAISLNASASDTEDGNISANISWTSSIDGVLGTGTALTKNLSIGTHLITASVQDSAGASHSSAVTITVSAAPVYLSVTAFWDGSRYKATLSWTGTSEDVDIYKNDRLRTTKSSPGTKTYRIRRDTTFKVCITDTQQCSQAITVVYPN